MKLQVKIERHNKKNPDENIRSPGPSNELHQDWLLIRILVL